MKPRLLNELFYLLNRQRFGHDLNGLSFAELHSLEDKISSSLDIIRKRTVGLILYIINYKVF